MKVVVLMPYRPDDEWRMQAFAMAYQQVKRLGLPTFVADSEDFPFSIARTWNLLAELGDQGGRWDVAVRWAADMSITDLEPVREAIRTVTHYTRPFDSSVRLSSAETHAYCTQGHLPKRVDPAPYGGISVITRDLWETVGGFDPRFVGYGAEDYAFMRGVQIHYGEPDRIPGRLVMMWHPHRKHTPEAAADPYWGRREANLAAYARLIEPLHTAEDWARYLAERGTEPDW